ncbi:TniQ family protein [Zhongshania aquimaris]|uniref:TniQ family protein n=1 Tax=Zhongshania aquimaris TaxID=2857107 RepID=A0ABS6VQF6_9GAMM|nr:TniQ family protein [Zhongshania aquimaris]MBW2940550.1 TniQ family protein [Zhongshania aquimaris]
MQLNFIPNARPNESLSGLLIRQASGVYQTPGELLANLGSKCNPPTELRALLRGNKSALKKLWRNSNWEPSPFYSFIAQKRDFNHWVNYNRLGVCPKCASDGLTLESHDFNFIKACTKHSMALSRQCHSCLKPFPVNRPLLTHCRCGEPIRSKAADPAQLEESQYLEALMLENDPQSLFAFKEIQSIMSERLSEKSLTVIDYRNFLEGNVDGVVAAVNNAIRKLPAISLRAICAPFACAKSDVIKLSAPRILSMVERTSAENDMKIKTPEFYLTHDEFRYAIGLKQKTAVVIESTYFDHKHFQGRSGLIFNYNKLSEFFAPLIHGNRCADDTTSSLAALSVSRKQSIAKLLEKIFSNDLPISSFDEKKPLSQIHTLSGTLNSSNTPAGFMTMDSVVAHLDSYEEAIRGARDAGLLPYTHQKSCNNRYLFAIKDVDAFHSKYVLIGELARELQYPPMRLSDRLRELGVVPVAGPYEGNSSVSTFKRADIEDVDLRAAIGITNYATNSGRNAGGTPSFDAETWATGHEVAAQLNVPIAQLHRITRHNLLVKGTPRIRGSQRRHYYRRDSIQNVVALLTDAVEVDHLAKELKANRKKLISRYLYLLKAEPIKVGAKTLIPIDDAKQLRAHYEQFKDASAAADYLSTTRHQIGNWKKASKLSPILKDDPNFIKSPLLYRVSDLDGMRNSTQLIRESRT